MRANIQEIKKLIKSNFRNNISYFADEIGVDASYVNTIINKPGKEGSNKFCNSIIKYCELHNLDFKQYIFLT